jgi:hypothetical protein
MAYYRLLRPCISRPAFSTRYMILLPLLLGTIAAFATSLTIALTVVPSMTTTVLKLRSGVMEFMRDPKQVRLSVPTTSHEMIID